MKTTQAIFRNTGGIHPEYLKDITAGRPIEIIPTPQRLYISMVQHIGAPSKPMIKKGDAVLRGQPIGEATGFVSARVHAPVAGVVKAIDERPTVSGRPAPVIEIEYSGEDRLHESCVPAADWISLSAKELVELVARAGIIGMGGAGFPTHVKLTPPPGKTIDTLIINGAECEPYLTADHRLMIEQAQEIWDGTKIIRKILGAKHVKVAVEDNKPDAIESMQRVMNSADDDVELVILKTEYPQGAEKQLIHAVTGREVPSGGLPMDVETLVENVATAAAIREAVMSGAPLMRRVVSVSGECVRNPKNILAPLGTTLTDLVNFCGGVAAEPAKIICGGPMMGVVLSSLDPGMNKTTSGLLLLPLSRITCFTSMPCIACGRCVAACPMQLMPGSLSEFIEAEDYKTAEKNNLLDCIECGACAFECPAHRPLVQHMKQGKAMITAIRRQREAERKKE